MPIRESSYGYWSSSRAFVWVATGATLGIGNVVRIPYLAGEYGGAAFLLVYVLFLLVIGLPLLVAEWMLGRWTRQDIVDGMERLAQASHARRGWSVIAWLSLVSGVLILSYYSVIAGWSFSYTLRAAGGMFESLNMESARDAFMHVVRDPERSLAWHTIFMVMICIIVIHGFREGIERAVSYMAPAALLLAILLLGYALIVGDIGAAASFMLKPDFAKLGWKGTFEAMHQAFFSLSLGVGAMFAYGTYLPAKARLVWLGFTVIGINILFSTVAGLALFALVFAAGLTPQPGLAMLFQVFPLSVPGDVEGRLVAAMFYFMLFIVTSASAVALMEPPTVFLMERRRMTRVFAATFTAFVIWCLGLGTLTSFNVLEELRFWDRNIFDWLQWVTARVFVPACGLLICIFAARIMPREQSREAWGESDRWAFGIWHELLAHPVRIAMIILLVYGLGLIDLLVGLWLSPSQ